MKTRLLIIIPIIVGMAISLPFVISSTSGGVQYTQEIDPKILEVTNGFALSSNMDIYKISLMDERQSLFFTVSQNTDGFLYMDDPLLILQKLYPENEIVSFTVLVFGEEISYTLEDDKLGFSVNNAHIIEIRGFSEI